MLTYPKINPIAFHLGPVKVHWYGLMYLFGFLVAWGLASYRSRQSDGRWASEQVADLIFYIALGVILGGRIGYMLFYDFFNFIHNPIIVFKVWDGGMSFHGGLLGVLLMTCFFSLRYKKPISEITDFVVPLAPLGLAFGRLGNFINGELWGRVTTVSWGMVFPGAGPLPRHPSQLYECFFEGIVLFCIIWLYSAKPRARGATSAWFLICYGLFRFCLEFFRQPDVQLGFIAFGWLTMGQLLSIPLILAGGFILLRVHRSNTGYL